MKLIFFWFNYLMNYLDKIYNYTESCLCVCVSVKVCVCVNVCLSAYLSVCLSVYLSFYLSIYNLYLWSYIVFTCFFILQEHTLMVKTAWKPDIKQNSVRAADRCWQELPPPPTAAGFVHPPKPFNGLSWNFLSM